MAGSPGADWSPNFNLSAGIGTALPGGANLAAIRGITPLLAITSRESATPSVGTTADPKIMTR
ncbi:MAG TPA: hypothetical protein V6D47_13845 [Oscillatoriaceae cyanobacterium]